MLLHNSVLGSGLGRVLGSGFNTNTKHTHTHTHTLLYDFLVVAGFAKNKNGDYAPYVGTWRHMNETWWTYTELKHVRKACLTKPHT
jgi:hypothetical protein